MATDVEFRIGFGWSVDGTDCTIKECSNQANLFLMFEVWCDYGVDWKALHHLTRDRQGQERVQEVSSPYRICPDHFDLLCKSSRGRVALNSDYALYGAGGENVSFWRNDYVPFRINKEFSDLLNWHWAFIDDEQRKPHKPIFYSNGVLALLAPLGDNPIG